MSDYQALGEKLMDQEGVNVERYMDEALFSLVEDLLTGSKVGGVTLHDYLEGADLAETVAAYVISGDRDILGKAIEAHLIYKLQDSDAQYDRAAELAGS